ncbi:MAG: hypothetical protein V3T70_09485 [Phycisphaerae bacterium]
MNRGILNGFGALSFAFALLAMRPVLASAQNCVPPPNEDCPDATVITQAELPLSIIGPLGCTNDVVDKPYRDVFYRFDCGCTGYYDLDMCDSAGDTYIRVWTVDCDWFTGGLEYAVGDDECPGSPPNADPKISVFLQTGTVYWFELGTWRPDPPWAPDEPNAPYNFNVSTCSPCGSGDVNGDGSVNGDDIPAFLSLVLNPPGSTTPAACAADVSGDMSVGIDDVHGFVQLLLAA